MLKVIEMKRKPNFIAVSVVFLIAVYSSVKIYSLYKPFEVVNFPSGQKWSQRFSGEIVGLSIAEDGDLLVRTQSSIYDVNSDTGDVIWKQALTYMQSGAMPAKANNGNVYLADDKDVWAINQKTGHVLWKQPLYNTKSWVTDVSVDAVIVNEIGAGILVYNASTGKELWRKPACRGYVQAKVIENDVYMPCDGVDAYDMISGERLWDDGLDSRIGNVAYKDNIIYYFIDSAKAYDLVDKKLVWDTPVAAIKNLEQFEIYDKNVFIYDASSICMIDADKGFLLWCNRNMVYPQSPSVVGNIVYVFSGSRKSVLALDLLTGKEIGHLAFPKISFLVVNRQLMVSLDGCVYIGNEKTVYGFCDSPDASTN